MNLRIDFSERFCVCGHAESRHFADGAGCNGFGGYECDCQQRKEES